MVAYF